MILTSTPAMGRPEVSATTSTGSPGRVMVQTPVVSVSPYDVTTELSPSTSNKSRTRVGGMTAAPVTPTRKDANADVPPRARSINAWKRVGGPWMTVTRWVAASASKRSGLKLTPPIGRTWGPMARPAHPPQPRRRSSLPQLLAPARANRRRSRLYCRRSMRAARRAPVQLAQPFREWCRSPPSCGSRVHRLHS